VLPRAITSLDALNVCSRSDKTVAFHAQPFHHGCQVGASADGWRPFKKAAGLRSAPGVDGVGVKRRDFAIRVQGEIALTLLQLSIWGCLPKSIFRCLQMAKDLAKTLET